jgi:hypothetical protein
VNCLADAVSGILMFAINPACGEKVFDDKQVRERF